MGWWRLAVIAIEFTVGIVCHLGRDSNTLGVKQTVARCTGQGGETSHSGTVDGTEDRRGHSGSDDLLGVGLMEARRRMEVGVASWMRRQGSDGDGGWGLTLSRDRDDSTGASIGQGRWTNGWHSWQIDCICC